MMLPINSDWDNQFLDTIEADDLPAFDDWTVEWMGQQGGGSAHEVRTWVAAFSALAGSGDYLLKSRFCEAIPAWIAGYAVVTAVQA